MKFAVIFDMDGVIIDSNPYHKKAWEIFCKKYGFSLTEDELEKKIFGRTGREALKVLFGDTLEDDMVKKYSSEINADYRNLFAPYIKSLPGLKEFLDSLIKENISFAIASSAPPINIEFVLRNTGLNDYFNIIVDDTQITKSKPDPEIYLAAARHLKIPPEYCIVIEDSLSGIKSALNAGMKVIGITTTHSAEELRNTDMIITDFTELRIEDLLEILKPNGVRG